MHEASRINTNLKESEAPLSERRVWRTARGAGPGARGSRLIDWVKPVAAAGGTRGLAGRAGPGPDGQGRSGWRGPSRSRRAEDLSLSSPVGVPRAMRQGSRGLETSSENPESSQLPHWRALQSKRLSWYRDTFFLL